MQLTLRQHRIVDFLRVYFQEHGVMPSVAEVQSAFSFRSPNAVTAHFAALEKKGVIRRVPGQARNIRLVEMEEAAVRTREKDEPLRIPLLGAIPAGYPEANEEAVLRRLPMTPESLGLSSKARLFALNVRGDSMVNAGIHDGDLVILEHGPSPRDGEIVAALLDGETTLKRYRHGRRSPYLQAENPAYPELIPAAELVIQGVFRALIRLATPYGL